MKQWLNKSIVYSFSSIVQIEKLGCLIFKFDEVQTLLFGHENKCESFGNDDNWFSLDSDWRLIKVERNEMKLQFVNFHQYLKHY
jgi:hypothetical protein